MRVPRDSTKVKTEKEPSTVVNLVPLVHTVINFNKKQFPRVKIVWPVVGPPPLVTVLLLLAPRVLHVAKANTIPCPNKPQ
jgi:hypothetical protein